MFTVLLKNDNLDCDQELRLEILAWSNYCFTHLSFVTGEVEKLETVSKPQNAVEYRRCLNLASKSSSTLQCDPQFFVSLGSLGVPPTGSLGFPCKEGVGAPMVPRFPRVSKPRTLLSICKIASGVAKVLKTDISESKWKPILHTSRCLCVKVIPMFSVLFCVKKLILRSIGTAQTPEPKGPTT